MALPASRSEPRRASPGRPVARAIAALALLVLGAVALDRLPLELEPSLALPELSVALEIDRPTDPEEVTRRFVVAVESAVRALGRVAAMRGEVGPHGAWLDVRFEPGTDIERKAARLASDLAALRSRWPEPVRLSVWPAASGDADHVAFLALTGPGRRGAAEAVARTLAAVPGVREVRRSGDGGRQIRVLLERSDPDLAAAIERSLDRALAPRWLGPVRHAGRRLGLVAGDGAGASRLEALTIPAGRTALALGSLATIEPAEGEETARAHADGQPALLLEVRREHEASLWRVGRLLEQRAAELSAASAGRFHIEIVESAADSLRRLVRGLLVALAALCLVGALVGLALGGTGLGWRLLLAPPVALAVSLNLLWLAGLRLDAPTLVVLAAGSAALLPLVLLRLRVPSLGGPALAATLLVSSAVVPVAAALAGGHLAALLAVPARAFLLVAAGSALTLLCLPACPGPAPGSLARAWLRRPATVLLGAGTVLYVLLTLFGRHLDPRAGSDSESAARFRLEVDLAEGTTLADSEQAVGEIEEQIARIEAIERSWSWIRPAAATIWLEVRSEDRTPRRRRRLETRLRYQLAGGAAALRLEADAPPGRLSLIEEYEERSAADPDGPHYRPVLRATDAHALATAFDRLRERLAPDPRVASIRPEWGAVSVRVDLEPRPGTRPEEARRLAAQLRERSEPPAGIRLPGPGERTLAVYPPWAPAPGDRVAQRPALLASVLPESASGGGAGSGVRVAGQALFARDSVLPPDLSRESGRFVLPVSIAVRCHIPEECREHQLTVDRQLATLPLPAGVGLERPVLAPLHFTRARLRLLGLAVLVPALLWLAATLVLDSAAAGLLALLPGAMGLAIASPLLASGRFAADELAILAVAATLATSLPAPLALLGDSFERGRRAAPALATYRPARQFLPALIAGGFLSGLALATAAAGLDPDRDPWAGALQLSAAVAVAVALSSALVLPAAALAGNGWRRRDPALERRRRHPPAWETTADAAQLEARRLTRHYPGGIRALHDVSFVLGPGIVGLLGPNGAGKTTLLRLLTGLLTPTRGQVRYRGVPLEGRNLAAFRHRLGFLPQEFNAYPGLTGEEFLDYWALEMGIAAAGERDRQVAALLATVGLEKDARRRVRDYSGGMRQRIGIARALLGSPELLIVDEPTTGLDIEARNRFRQVLVEVARERIVLLSTHLAGDIEATAGRLLLLSCGRLRLDAAPAALIAAARGRVFQALVEDDALRVIGRQHRIVSRVRRLEGIELRAVAPPGVELAGMAVEPTLEEAYIAFLQAEEGDGGQGAG